MSLPPPTPPSRSLQILGLIAGVSLAAGATNMVANALLPIQFLGGGAIFNFIM